MINKTLLVLAPDYPSEKNEFYGCNTVKNQITHSRKVFKKVIVIAPVLKTLGFTPQDKFCKNYSYDNVDVYFPRCLFFPRIIKVPGISNYTKLSIDNRFAVTMDTIVSNDLSFDIVHAHFTYPSAYIASEIKKKYNVPVIVTVHEDSGWFKEERDMNHPYFLQAWKSADILTRVNTTELPILKQYNENVTCVPGGYKSDAYRELGRMACRKHLNIDLKERIIFTFGFLDERKGFQDLIVAISRLPPQYHDVKCYISGSGYYQETLEQLIKKLNLEKNVFIIKRCDDNLLAVWINAADLFIMPSLKESFGSTQIEALGCGTPVIASDNVGSIDVINDTCGYLFKTGDTYDLSSKLVKGLTTPWDKYRILEYAKNKYAWEVVSKQYDEMYMGLVKDDQYDKARNRAK